MKTMRGWLDSGRCSRKLEEPIYFMDRQGKKYKIVGDVFYKDVRIKKSYVGSKNRKET